jgi:PadR family transcriptional regulator PadR
MLDARLIHRDFLQGMVKIFILHHASQGPVYGNKLSKALHALGYRISPGSLYPLLHHLENSGLLHSRLRVFKGRLRKYYQLTEAGRLCLSELRGQLRGLVQTVILAPLPESAPQNGEANPTAPLPVNG